MRQAATDGPQTITVHGRPAAVLLSAEEYPRLTRPATSLIEFFQQSPLFGVDLDLERDSDPGRDVTLTVVTRNSSDLQRCGARVIDPW